MQFSDVMLDDQDDHEEVIFVTPHVQPIFEVKDSDSDDDSQLLYIELVT